MSKSKNKNAKVFFRIFPLEKITWDFLKIKGKIVYIRHLQELSDESSTKDKPKFWEFKTDGIFFNSSQEYVYTNVMDNMLDRIIEGHNGIIVAYGQTGTGKTVTLGGLQLSLEDLGIIPRIIYDLLKLKKELPKNIKMCIQISYMEFSKSTAADLLKEYPNFVDMYKSREATKIKVTNEYEALKLIYKGEGRKTFATNNTYLSNLCTSVVTFHITTKNMDYSSPQKTTSRLHVIDTVGVDTVGNISSFFKNSYDIGNGNLIKTNLEQFLLCLLKNIPSQTKLKERTNPLIYFLGSDLSSESLLRFIGHIRVLKRDIMITISMFRFGQLVRGLKPKIKEIIHEVNEETQIQYLQNELNRLQKEQIHCSVLLNQDLTDNMNQDRIEHIQRTIKKYLNDQISEINILNVAEAFSVFKEFKEICNQFDTDRCRLNEELHNEISTKFRRDSKASSRSSLRGSKLGVKRMSKKSRDSVVSIEERKKKDDNISPQYSPSSTRRHSSASYKAAKKDSVISSGSQVVKKRSSAGSAVKRASVNRKKSVVSTSVPDKIESRNFLNEINLMPEIIPEYRQAWDMYVNDPDSSYRTILDNFIKNANDMQHVYGTYLAQMKILQQCKQIAEKRKNDVLEARMIRSFNDTYRSTHSDEEVVPSSTEKLCEENLNVAKNNLTEQQEVVLKWQSELKICLNTRREMKNFLNGNFENYCKERYKVPIPNLSEDEEVIQDITLDMKAQEVDEDIHEAKQKCLFNDRVININNLRKVMRRALLKDLKLKAKKNLTWKNIALCT